MCCPIENPNNSIDQNSVVVSNPSVFTGPRSDNDGLPVELSLDDCGQKVLGTRITGGKPTTVCMNKIMIWCEIHT